MDIILQLVAGAGIFGGMIGLAVTLARKAVKRIEGEDK